jgi:hypothetical protein
LLKPLIAPPESGRARHRQILETLKLGFAVGAKMHGWVAEFEWLFDLRDAALHHTETFRVPIPHPRLPTNVAVENRDYSLESAERAFRLLDDVLRKCLDHPKSATARWASEKRAGTLDMLDR